MLTIGKLGCSPDQLGYYEQQVAQGLEDYLSGRGESPGRWMGRGCAGIAASGQVDRDGFMRAMAGCDPLTGAPLRPPRARTKVAAFDFTFSAPKSVSVLFAVGDEVMSSALLESHELAVVAAAYRHRFSRAGDPQLHTHLVVANMTKAEGRWTTLEAHGLYQHALAAGAAEEYGVDGVRWRQEARARAAEHGLGGRDC